MKGNRNKAVAARFRLYIAHLQTQFSTTVEELWERVTSKQEKADSQSDRPPDKT
jgi:hypothetical protein